MTNQIFDLLHRAMRVRDMIEAEARSRDARTLRLLRLKKLSLRIRQRLGDCLRYAAYPYPALVPAAARTRRACVSDTWHG